MGEVTLTIGQTAYHLHNFTYALNRTQGAPPGSVNRISLSFAIHGEHNLDSFIMKEPFACTIQIHDETGGTLNQLDCGGVEITSFDGSVSNQDYYIASVQMEAKIIRLPDGTLAQVKGIDSEEDILWGR
jgi:hypothetical protein